MMFKNDIIIAVFSLLPILGFTQNDTINQKDENGEMQGYWIFYGKDRPNSGYPADGKVEEGTLVNSRKEGVWKKYYPDGVTVKIEGEYKNNRPNGRYAKYHTNGNLSESGFFTYTRSRSTWPRRKFHQDGRIDFSTTFVDNQRIDSIFDYYPNNCIQKIVISRTHENYGIYLHFSDSVCNEPTARDSFSLKGPTVCFTTPIHEPFIYDSSYQQKGAVKEESANSEITYQLVENDTLNTGVYFGAISEIRTVNDEVKQSVICGIYSKVNAPRMDGYNKLYNSDDEVFIDGEFINGKLNDGKVYIYDKDGILLRIKVYKNGSYHSEGQL